MTPRPYFANPPRPRLPPVSKAARVVSAIVLIAGVILAAVSSWVYRDSSDGQAGALPLFLILYALLAVGIVWAIDRVVGWLRR
jgi:hypothetical protein